MTDSAERNAHEAWDWGAALAQVSVLIVASFVLSLAIGYMHPIASSMFSNFRALMQGLAVSALMVLLPVIVTFVLSLLLSYLQSEANVRRSFRDGLAAAWFFILAINVGAKLAYDPLLEDQSRQGTADTRSL